MDAAEDLLKRQSPGGGRVPEGDFPGLNRTVISVRNALGERAERSMILGLGDWSFDPDSGDNLEELHETLCVEGVEPEAGTHDDAWAVLPDDLEDGEIGEAVLTGLVLVTVNISDASHKFCTIDDGNVQQLKSAHEGRGRILKAQDGTGNKYALVELGPFRKQFYRGTTSGALDKGTSGDVDRLGGGGGTDTVTNELADIGDGKLVYYHSDGDRWILYAAECPLT